MRAAAGRGSGEVRPCGWWRLRPHLLPTASTFRRDPRKTPTTIHKHCSAGHERGGPRAPGGEPEASEPPGHTETARQDMRTSLNTVHLMAKQLDKQSQDGRSQLHWFRAFVLPCIRCDPWKATNTSIVLGSVRCGCRVFRDWVGVATPLLRFSSADWGCFSCLWCCLSVLLRPHPRCFLSGWGQPFPAASHGMEIEGRLPIVGARLLLGFWRPASSAKAPRVAAKTQRFMHG